MKKTLAFFIVITFLFGIVGCTKKISKVQPISSNAISTGSDATIKPQSTDSKTDEKTKPQATPSKTDVKTEQQVTPAKQTDWEGNWLRINSNQYVSSEITIKEVTDTQFHFILDAHNGLNLGSIDDSVVTIVNNEAVFKVEDFKLTLILDGEVLKVTTEGFEPFGSGVSGMGEYRKDIVIKTKTLVESGVFENNSQEEMFKNIVSKDYEVFINYFQGMRTISEDEFGATVKIGWIVGGWEPAIIMYTPNNVFWAAFDSDNIKFYTNAEDKSVIPKFILDWANKKKKNIVNMSIKQE